MSFKISITDAALRYRVSQRTIHRWAVKYEITQYEDGLYDRDQLDDINDSTQNLIIWKLIGLGQRVKTCPQTSFTKSRNAEFSS